jgi:hypothetical protein
VVLGSSPSGSCQLNIVLIAVRTFTTLRLRPSLIYPVRVRNMNPSRNRKSQMKVNLVGKKMGLTSEQVRSGESMKVVSRTYLIEMSKIRYMDIRAKNSDKTILEVSDDEFVLIQHLLEKSMKETEQKGVVLESKSKSMFNQMNDYDFS